MAGITPMHLIEAVQLGQSIFQSSAAQKQNRAAEEA